MKLHPSIHVFERGWLSSNNVLLLGRHDAALIDSGYVTHRQQTLELVRHALRGRHLDRLYNTHLHSDHCGGNAALQAHFGCDTFIPEAEADKVRRWDEDALSFKATGQQCERFTIDGVVTPGETLTLGDLEWQVLGAPGHHAHSVIYYCPSEKVLVSADALWQNGFGVIFPELEDDGGFAEAGATLDLIAGLDVRVVIPGHGAVFDDVAGALARAAPPGLPVGRPQAQCGIRGQGAAQIPAAGAPEHAAGRAGPAAGLHSPDGGNRPPPLRHERRGTFCVGRQTAGARLQRARRERHPA
jgi:glyoxylase-like metal-dependent hydrolase (beta-lactamase superfamily II)